MNDRKVWVLEVSVGNHRVRRMKLDAPEVILGRGRDCHIQLPSDSVSRRHARLAPASTYVILEDLGSTNGTYLHDRPVTRAMLADGDRVFIGPYACAIRRTEDELDLKGVPAATVVLDDPGTRTAIMDDEVRRRVQAPADPLEETVQAPSRKSPLR